MNVPFLDISDQDAMLREEIIGALNKVISKTAFSSGEFVDTFEEQFAGFCGAKYCVAVNSGTSALHLALISKGVGPGDEVLTVPNTFISTCWAISYCNASPKLIDVGLNDALLDMSALESNLTPKTKVVVPVHLYGNVCDVIGIRKYLDVVNPEIQIVEDAAQAHCAYFDGKIVGSSGNTTCFSFYPGKNLGAYGEGGAILTDSKEEMLRLKSLRNHAQSERYHHSEIGFNHRMDGMQAAVLSIKLRSLKRNTIKRQDVASRYNSRLSSLPNIRLLQSDSRVSSSNHIFVIHHHERDELAKWLNDRGIQTGLHYPIPIHLQKAYSQLQLQEGSFPNSEKNARECLSLPIHPTMSHENVDYVCDMVEQFTK